jgi:DNA-binding HxlR family transcriptional regulator
VKKKIEFRSLCPISTALDIFGDKWSLLIIRDVLFNGKNTYGEFLNSEEKMATNILADRLLQLEAGGLVTRHAHPESKLKVLYKPTAKALDLIPTLVELISWSERHHEVHPYAKQFARLVKKDKEGMLKKLRADVSKLVA